MISFISARKQITAVAVALVTLFFAAPAWGDKLPGYGAVPTYSTPTVPHFTPPTIPTLGYAPKGYQRPTYTPPAYTPPSYRPVSYKPTTYKPAPHRPTGYRASPRPTVNPQRDPGSRVFYVPVPKYQEKVVHVAKPAAVKKTVRVSRYMVEQLHAGRCIRTARTNVYLQPSRLSEVIGDVVAGEKVHVNVCLTDNDMKRQWCSLKNAKGIEAWIPAEHLQLCGW